MPNVIVKHERARGCGYRKGGGYYFMLEEYQGHPCGKLPHELTYCPCCGAGIKFSRGFQWIDAKMIFPEGACELDRAAPCNSCVLCHPPEKMGLIWIGKQFYKTPQDWIKEGEEMGVSRRIKSIPKGFEVGKTWVAVAHIEAFASKNPDGSIKQSPAIFQVFRPTHIEYVVKGDETPEELEEIEKRGVTLVKVIPVGDQDKPSLFDVEEEADATPEN
jgi:hypothetical protein